MKNLLITQFKTNNLQEVVNLENSAIELGWGCAFLNNWKVPSNFNSAFENIALYGSFAFCLVIAEQLELKLINNPPDWLTNIPNHLLGRDIFLSTIGEIAKSDQAWFIKPLEDKIFPAKVYQPGEFKPSDLLAADTPCLVSNPVKFVAEYRSFIDGEKILTTSCYLKNNQINNVDNWESGVFQVEDWLNAVLKQGIVSFQPSVIDIGILDNDKIVFIESNPAYSSGLYGCDPKKVLEVLPQCISSC